MVMRGREAAEILRNSGQFSVEMSTHDAVWYSNVVPGAGRLWFHEEVAEDFQLRGEILALLDRLSIRTTIRTALKIDSMGEWETVDGEFEVWISGALQDLFTHKGLAYPRQENFGQTRTEAVLRAFDSVVKTGFFDN